MGNILKDKCNDIIAFDMSTITLFNEDYTIDKKREIIEEIEDNMSKVLRKYNCSIVTGTCKLLNKEEFINKTGAKEINK